MMPSIGDAMFRRWARLVGREDLLDDPRFRDDISRGNNYQVINEVMAAWCAGRTRAEALAELERARIPCGPVYELDEVLTDPQVKARGLMVDAPGDGDTAKVPLVHPAVRLLGTPGTIRRRAPRLGEHTDEVLAEAGFDSDAIAAFRTLGVI
jgi:crotonobetainyl-CoA:carnitine CoA-transferase CaiB-like acyl-CoA transferase